MTDDTAVLTIRVPTELKARLEALATATQRSRSWLAADALRAYIEAEEWQIAEIVAGVGEAERGEFATADEVDTVLDRWATR